VPADARRAERRILLLDAGFELLGTEGSAGTTVRAVCQQSRLNPRYFYESFDDLEELVVAVYDRVVDELRVEVLAAIDRAGPDPKAQTRAAIERIVGFVDEDRRRARVLYVEALGSEAVNRRRIETGHAIVALVERDAAARQGPPPEGEHIGRIAAAVLVGGLSELLVAWLDGRIDVTREQLVDDATGLFLALGDAAGRIAGTRRQGKVKPKG
jgi:AcrR family transcriptional regulator